MRFSKLPTLEDQFIVTTENWGINWAQGSESLEAGGFDRRSASFARLRKTNSQSITSRS
ncbi:MAG: hypothetical protein OJF50_003029 [Nitrospira sp.]|jgi:hypothetical protein|nr:hypothetical protein [Nitrospira sp.]